MIARACGAGATSNAERSLPLEVTTPRRRARSNRRDAPRRSGHGRCLAREAVTNAIDYDESDLARFRDLQRLAYDVVEEVGAGLTVGITEREAAARIRERMAERGVSQFFHEPFAWFGDRTSFRGIRTPLYFFPTRRRLEHGMPFILDVAPIRDGYAADVGYTSRLGPNEVLDRIKGDLRVLRDELLAMVRAERSMRAIYVALDETIADLGYVNVHTEYPFHVLGHRVGRIPLHRLPGIHIGGFDVRTSGWLFGRYLGSQLPRLARQTPFWNGSDHAEARAEPGLWALEPHVGRGGVGAKWEEMLVVTEADAYWLDDDLPHVREWRSADGSSVDAAPRKRAAGER